MMAWALEAPPLSLSSPQPTKGALPPLINPLLDNSKFYYDCANINQPLNLLDR